VATSGPGATNLITGIADAQIDSTPMVCITGQVARHLLGSDAFQETDIIGISTPVTKWNCQVTKASEIPEVLARRSILPDRAGQDPYWWIYQNAQIDEFDCSYEHCTGYVVTTLTLNQT
jgi:acetolactate synthase-1/2/3 large subunit